MNLDLRTVLPMLMPKAIAWAESRAQDIWARGSALTGTAVEVAGRVGVAEPERIRVLLVPQLPMPDDPLLRAAAEQTALLGPGMVGLTLGHGIYICHGYATMRLLSHECRHVHQYEVAGSIASYLPLYLEQIVEVGYQNAPFEVDARAHECDA